MTLGVDGEADSLGANKTGWNILGARKDAVYLLNANNARSVPTMMRAYGS